MGRKEGNVLFAENINKHCVQHDCNTYGREGRKEGNVLFAENIKKHYVQHDCNTYVY